MIKSLCTIHLCKISYFLRIEFENRLAFVEVRLLLHFSQFAQHNILSLHKEIFFNNSGSDWSRDSRSLYSISNYERNLKTSLSILLDKNSNVNNRLFLEQIIFALFIWTWQAILKPILLQQKHKLDFCMYYSRIFL